MTLLHMDTSAVAGRVDPEALGKRLEDGTTPERESR